MIYRDVAGKLLVLNCTELHAYQTGLDPG